MKEYRAIVNLTLFVGADSEDKAQEAINGEFVDRLLSITANHKLSDGVTLDDLFDFEFELVQIEER